MKNDSMTILFFVALIVALVILAPIAVIWSLNTLFPVLAIPFNFNTWCATVIISGVFKTTITTKK